MTEEVKQEEALYAGKYKTVDALVDGYKNSAKVLQEKDRINDELSKKLDEVTKVPDDYLIPEGIEKTSEIDELKTLALRAGLTQSHFDKMASEKYSISKAKKEELDNAMKAVGEDTLQVINDYVKKTYPEKMHDVVMNKLILDNEARKEALGHRESLLNSSNAGMRTVTHYAPSVTKDDMEKAAKDHLTAPHDRKLRERYLKLTADYVRMSQ